MDVVGLSKSAKARVSRREARKAEQNAAQQELDAKAQFNQTFFAAFKPLYRRPESERLANDSYPWELERSTAAKAIAKLLTDRDWWGRLLAVEDRITQLLEKPEGEWPQYYSPVKQIVPTQWRMDALLDCIEILKLAECSEPEEIASAGQQLDGVYWLEYWMAIRSELLEEQTSELKIKAVATPAMSNETQPSMTPEDIEGKAWRLLRKQEYSSRSALARDVGCNKNAVTLKRVWELYAKNMGKIRIPHVQSLGDSDPAAQSRIEQLIKEQERDALLDDQQTIKTRREP